MGIICKEYDTGSATIKGNGAAAVAVIMASDNISYRGWPTGYKAIMAYDHRRE
jgi:hypothetical protein